MPAPPLRSHGFGQVEDQVRGQRLRPVVEEHRHAVVVGQGDLLGLSVGIDHGRLSDGPVNHDHGVGRGGVGLCGLGRILSDRHGKVDGRVDPNTVEDRKILRRRVHIGIVDTLIQKGPELPVICRGEYQSNQVSGHSPYIVILHSLQPLDHRLHDLFDGGCAGSKCRTFFHSLGEKGGIQLCRHSVDMVVSTPGHDVPDAEGVQVELRGFLHNLSVGAQVYGGRRDGERCAPAGGSGRAVVLRGTVLESPVLYGSVGRVAGVGLGLQARGQRVLLDILNHQAGHLGQFHLGRPGLDQADCFCSCHVKSSFLCCFLNYDRAVNLWRRGLLLGRVGGCCAFDVRLGGLLGLKKVRLCFPEGLQHAFQVGLQRTGGIHFHFVHIQEGDDVSWVVGLIRQGHTKGGAFLDFGNLRLVACLEIVHRGLGCRDVVRNLRRIARSANGFQGFSGLLQSIFSAGLPAVRAVVFVGRDVGSIVPDNQIHVLSILAFALQGCFHLPG
nr:MAG TPA: hypothetical protein [Caudoviricetes sp.]